MPAIASDKPYRVGRSRTGLGLFATKPIKKGTRIIRYFGPLLDCDKEDQDAIENKYLFQLTNRWTIDGAVRENIARYINHSCRPNCEPIIKAGRVFIYAKRAIREGEELVYNYGERYFKDIIEPMGCRCAKCSPELYEEQPKDKKRA